MKRSLVMLIVFLVPLTAGAQINFFAGYQQLEAPFWDLLRGPSGTLLKNGFTLGSDYHLRITKGELYLLPRVQYSRFNAQHQDGLNESEIRSRILQLQIPLEVYPLAYFLSCDCPEIKNGVFFQGAVGVSRFALQYSDSEYDLFTIQSSPSLGWAMGINLSYLDWISISPQFHFTHHPSVSWNGLEVLRTSSTDFFFREETFLNQTSFELHLKLYLGSRTGRQVDR
jgi:hypothetical protein